MAVYSEVDRRAIDALCERWREDSLIGNASLLHPEEFPSCWSEERLKDLHERFWGNPLEGSEGGGSFASKWEIQLQGASTEVRLLAAECLLVYYLITMAVGPDRKRQMINTTIGPDHPELHVGEGGEVFEALTSYIANPGMYYNTRQDLHVGYVMDLALRLKALPPETRAELLRDEPWEFARFAAEGQLQSDAMRNIVCHLLYPEQFERIISNRHKQLVLQAFEALDSSGTDAGLDERLYSIRQKLKEKLPGWGEARRDYYHSDLQPIWVPTSGPDESIAMDPASALEFKKQIVFYGPPGTGKTYRAGQVAESMIRQAALERWGVGDYFNGLDKVEQAVSDHVTRLQMHPSYRYSEFMIGLRLNADGGTSYQLGALPRIIEQMREERRQVGDRALPHVLILDEINRTDLSAMFGEAFSAMERDKRGVEIALFGEDADGEQIRFTMPSDLYIIGTMNEIDQSVEALDFALRRRFFWFPTPYEEQALFSIWGAQWGEEAPGVAWEDALPQLQQLAQCVSRLNDRIAELPDLGPEYELGAAVFGDLPHFIGLEKRTRSRRISSGRYLWSAKGEPTGLLLSMWVMTVEPVLAQYLAGSDRRAEQLAELKELFLNPPKS